jgi:hypothetical protein
MAFEYTYKLQGDGRDSWKRTDTVTGMVDMVYEDPTKSELIKMFEKATVEELKIIKDKLK